MAVGINAKASIDGAKKFQDDLKAMTAKGKALDAEMKALGSAFDKEGKSQKNNEKQREALNKAIEAQKEKAKLLSDQIKKLEDAGEGETTQCYKLRQQLAETNQKINEYSNGQSKAAKETGISTAQLIKAGAALAALKIAAGAVVGAVKGIAKAAVNAAKGIWNLGVQSGQWADELITNSTQMGVDVETLQEWGYAARFIDTEVSTMTGGMKRLTQVYAKGTSARKKSVKIAKGVTVSLKKENGEIKSQSEFYLDVIDSLHGMTNVAQRNAAAQKLFGKSYTDMIPLIESGTGALRQYSAEARDMGVVISADNVTALGQFDDQMQRFDATVSAIKTNLAVAFLPILETVAGKMTGFMGVVSKAISDGLQQEDVDTIVDAFFDMFTSDMTDDSAGGNQDMTAGQFIIALIKKFGEKIIENKDTIKEKAGQIWEYLKEKFNEIKNDPTVQETLGSIGSTLGEAIVTGIKNGIKNGVKNLFSFNTSGISNPAMARAVGMSNAQTSVLTGVFPEEETVKGWGKEASNAYIEGLKTESGPYETEAKAYAAVLETYLKTGQKSATWGAEVASGFASGITEGQPQVESAADDEIGAVEQRTGPSAHSKSTHWGHELASGYADGIRAGIPEVSAASDALARAAAAPIHYSLPDYGPLREVGKWGGEMIDKYVAGINRNVWKVGNAINNALPVAGRTTNYGGVSINVYGTAGQDVNALADIVMTKMQNAVNRREAVFA